MTKLHDLIDEARQAIHDGLELLREIRDLLKERAG